MLALVKCISVAWALLVLGCLKVVLLVKRNGEVDSWELVLACLWLSIGCTVVPWGNHWRNMKELHFWKCFFSVQLGFIVSSNADRAIENSWKPGWKVYVDLIFYVDGFCTSKSNRIMSECQTHVDMWSKCGDSKYLLGHTMAYLDWLYCIFIDTLWATTSGGCNPLKH